MKTKTIDKYFNLFAYFVIFIFFIAGTLVSLHRFWQYDVWYYDFGIFSKAIWNVSRFKPPTIDHFIVPGKIIFADHFNPSIFLLTPLYWFFPHAEILLIAQAGIVTLSGFVLYRIGQEVLKNNFLSFAILCSYFLFTGLQNAVITEFHELTISTLFMTMTFWSIIKGYKKWYLLFFLIVLGFKESLFLFGIGVSFFVLFYRKEWRGIAFLTLLFSISWFLFTTNIIIPFFSGRPYYYTQEIPNSFRTIFVNLYTPSIKIKTVCYTLLSFLFLPLFYLPLLPTIFLNFLSRFISPGSTRWDLGLHYSAEVAPVLAFSSILTLSKYKKKLHANTMFTIGSLLIMVSVFLYRFILRGPFGLAYNPVFYAHTKNFRYLDEMVKMVPKNSSVVAQNNLASKFLYQQTWILTENYKTHKADYIVFDLRNGQNPNNFLGAKNIQNILKDVQSNAEYQIFFHNAEQYIFKRI